MASKGNFGSLLGQKPVAKEPKKAEVVEDAPKVKPTEVTVKPPKSDGKKGGKKGGDGGKSNYAKLRAEFEEFKATITKQLEQIGKANSTYPREAKVSLLKLALSNKKRLAKSSLKADFNVLLNLLGLPQIDEVTQTSVNAFIVGE